MTHSEYSVEPRFRVSVIENKSDTIAAILSFLSEIKDCSVRVFASTQEALQDLTAETPHVILFVHGISGEDSAACWKELGTKFPTAIMIVSLAEQYVAEVELYSKAGAYECLLRDHTFHSKLRHALKKIILSRFAPSEAAKQSSLSAFEPGETVLHYKILEEVRSWGIGEIYRAEDVRSKQIVAIRVFPPAFFPGEESRLKFIADASITVSIRHPNVASILSLETSNELILLISEYVGGESLREWIDNSAVGLIRVIDIGAQIADGLEALHEAGLFHGDIKPSNIRITDSGTAKLLLTIARPGAPGLTTRDAGLPLDQVLYMSPEQVRGSTLDARSNIFSLGSVLYHAATAHAPFQGSNSMGVMLEIVTEEPPLPSEKNPELPEEFDKIMTKALSKEPNNRYESASDFSYALLRLKVSLSHDLSRAEIDTQTEAAPPAATDVPHKRHGVLYAILLASVIITAFLFYLHGIAGKPKIALLAVLPFLSGPGADHIADGLTENIIKDLSRSPQLKVLSESTMFRYRRTQIEPIQIGESLKADYILFGRVTGKENLSVELHDLNEHKNLWSEKYLLEDPFALQYQTAKEIRSRLNIPDPGQTGYIPKRLAQELFLRGRYAYNKNTEKDLNYSLHLYKSALVADSNFAGTYSAIAESWIALADPLRPEAEVYSQAREAASRALQLDDLLPDAHRALGIIHLIYDWDFAAAESELRRAIDLRPNDARTRVYLAMLLTATQRDEEAYREIRQAEALDPFSTELKDKIAWTLVQLRKFDEAIQQCRQAAQWEKKPSFYITLGDAYLGSGKNDEAIGAYRQADAFGASSAPLRTVLAMASSGMQSESRRLLASIEKRQKPETLRPDFMAAAYATTGYPDKALLWLDKAFQERSSSLIMLKVDFTFDPLRTDPRFERFLRQIGTS